MEKFPEAQPNDLPTSVFDHVPLLVDTNHLKGGQPFQIQEHVVPTQTIQAE